MITEQPITVLYPAFRIDIGVFVYRCYNHPMLPFRAGML